MGGDFHCNLEPMIDTRNYENPYSRPRTRAKINSVMAHFDLVDVFRSLYPEKKAFSWRKFKSVKQGRLDYFLISQSMTGEVNKASITPGYRSYHSIVNLSLKKIFNNKDFFLYRHLLLIFLKIRKRNINCIIVFHNMVV